MHNPREKKRYTIWKYNLALESFIGLGLPKGAKILKIDVQYDQPCLWALVNTEEKETDIRRLLVQGTGHPIEFPLEELTYIDTFQMAGGTFIWHVFELK